MARLGEGGDLVAHEHDAHLRRALKIEPRHPRAGRKLAHVRAEATRPRQHAFEAEAQLAAARAAAELCADDAECARRELEADNAARDADGPLIVGKVGVDVTTEEAYRAAKYAGLNLLATLQAELGGDLNYVREAELMHGRQAMLACVGMIFPSIYGKWPGEFYANVPTNPFEAQYALPDGVLAQLARAESLLIANQPTSGVLPTQVRRRAILPPRRRRLSPASCARSRGTRSSTTA